MKGDKDKDKSGKEIKRQEGSKTNWLSCQRLAAGDDWT